MYIDDMRHWCEYTSMEKTGRNVRGKFHAQSILWHPNGHFKIWKKICWNLCLYNMNMDFLV